MIRRRSCAAVLSAGLIVATMTPAKAQSWNLYNGDTTSLTIPFVGGSMSSTNGATVNLSVGGGQLAAYTVDTGSTGIVVSSQYFTPGPNDVYVGQGNQTYTSSGKVENGSFYLTSVGIYNGSTLDATARVTVLEVTSESCETGHPNCGAQQIPNIAYMGVGFDRGVSSVQPPAPYNNTNPFINIVSLASGKPVSSLAPGYIITNSSVTLGLTSNDTNGFAFVKLSQNTTNNPPQPAPAWLSAPVTISVNGSQSSGTILPDSGINYAYLTRSPGASVTTTTTCNSPQVSFCLAPGNTIQVYLPGQTSPQPAFYTFTTGAPGNALQPNTVSLNSPSTTAFLNTGREFYAGFNYLYDPINGFVGYQWNGTVSNSFGAVTPSVALIGNFYLPTGFAVSLPIILYGATTFLEAGTGTISSTISGSFDLTIGGGQIILTGASTYTGNTIVNAGTLEVDGSIANTSSVTVNSGGTLSGTGVVDPVVTTIMSGGTLAPGNAANPTGMLTIAGNLAFQSGAIYLVQVTPTAAASTTVTGAASLNGTVQVNFASSSYVAKQYTILTATGGVSGAFASLTNVNLPVNFADSLSYDGNNVYLNLTGALGAGSALNQNQQNVANALNTYFNNGGVLPSTFSNLFGLTGVSLTNALTQLDGEVSSDAELGAFAMMTQFLGLMLNPFVDGRLGGFGGGGNGGNGGSQAIGFAPAEQAFLPPDVALAYASILTKAPQPPPFQQRWSMWGTSYGGGNWTNGNGAVGSNNVNSQTYGFVGGADYHLSPGSIVGFALGGGGLSWGLANANGSGRSDAFQAGVYGITRFGPAYLSGAFGFANQWMTTNRSALGDIINASFAGQSYGGRFEGGYRIPVLPVLGVTPYGAVQPQLFRTPSYSETDLTGGGLGLTFASASATDVRTEIGSRLESPILLGYIPLILRGRVAWAHDFANGTALSAAFQALPGTGFVVNGAAVPQNSALASAGAELFLTSKWTMLVKFDSEFASGSQTYAGTGMLRYTW